MNNIQEVCICVVGRGWRNEVEWMCGCLL